MKRRKRTHTKKEANVSGGRGGFRLPPDVSVSKQPLPYGIACVFRYRPLGDVGRIVVENICFWFSKNPLDSLVAGDSW